MEDLKNKPEENQEPIDFPLFKRFVIKFAKDYFHACKDFCQEVTDAESEMELKRILYNHESGIVEKLGHECENDDCDNCSDKDGEIRDLEEKLEAFSDFPEARSIADELKLKSICQHFGNYSIEEMEYLMENGRQLLNSKLRAA